MCPISHKIYSKSIGSNNSTSFLHEEVSSVNSQLETYDLSSRKRKMKYTNKDGKVRLCLFFFLFLSPAFIVFWLTQSQSFRKWR